MSTITDAQWQAFRDAINSAHDFFNQDIVTWMKRVYGIQRFGEDDSTIPQYTPINLRCLISYNVFRTWPINEETTSGQLDKESVCMILNVNYLSGLGYLDPDGNLNFNPGDDYFIFQGQKYRATGDLPVSQAKDAPLLIYVILKRLGPNTGTIKYGTQPGD